MQHAPEMFKQQPTKNPVEKLLLKPKKNIDLNKYQNEWDLLADTTEANPVPNDFPLVPSKHIQPKRLASFKSDWDVLAAFEKHPTKIELNLSAKRETILKYNLEEVYGSKGMLNAKVELQRALDDLNVKDVRKLTEKQKSSLLTRVGATSRHLVMATLNSTVAKDALYYMASSKVGKAVTFVTKTAGMMWLGGVFGNPLAASLAVNLAVTVLKAIPKLVRDPTTGQFKQLGVDIVGVASQIGISGLTQALTENSGFVGQLVGGVIGTIIGNRFEGYFIGTGNPPAFTIETPTYQLEPKIPEPPANLSEAKQLKWYNRNKTIIMSAVGVSAVATVLTSAMVNDFSAVGHLFSVHKDGSMGFVSKTFRRIWRIGKHNGYVKQITNTMIATALSMPAGWIADKVKESYTNIMTRAGIDKKTESILPKTIINRIRNKAIREALYQFNVANLSILGGELLEISSNVALGIGTDHVMNSEWVSVAEAKQSIATSYEHAKEFAQKQLDTVKQFNPLECLAALSNPIKNPIPARNARLAERIAKRNAAQQQKVERFNEKAKGLQERAQFVRVDHRASAKAKLLADREVQRAKRAEERLKRLNDRDARLADRLAKRAALGQLDPAEIQAQIEKSKAWMTHEMTHAVAEFRKTAAGITTEALIDVFGVRMKALGYQAAKLAVTGGSTAGVAVKATNALGHIADTIGYVEAASTINSVYHIDSDFAAEVQDAVHGYGEPVRKGINKVLKYVDEFETEYAGFNVFNDVFQASGYNPFANTFQHRLAALGRIAVGEKLVNLAGVTK